MRIDKKRATLNRSLLLSLNNKLFNCVVYNYLNLSVSSGVLAALFLTALVAAAHSNESYSYDKKHFLHKC